MEARLGALVIGALLVAPELTAQHRTLWDTVREHDRSVGPLDLGLAVTYSPKDLPALVSEADLVVEGTIRSAQARLNDEETWIMTTYELKPGRILFVREPSESPQSHSTVLFQHVGGTLEMLGMNVSMYDENFKLLKVNQRVVVFLKRSDTPHTFNIISGPFGCFLMRSGRLAPADDVVRRVHAALEGADVLRLAGEIQTIIKQRAR